MAEIERTFLNSDRTLKVEIFQRADSTFGFEEFKFGTEEQAWFPVGEYSIAIINSLEQATKEAKDRIAWISHES